MRPGGWHLLLVCAVGCARSQLAECPNGLICPSGTVCSPSGTSCGGRAQVEACAEQAEGDSCSYPGGGIASCHDGICVSNTSCGDGKVAPPELCDGAPPAGQTCLSYGFDSGSLGCSTACGPDLTRCRKLGWQVMPTGIVAHMSRVWGNGPRDVFALHDGGIIHYDGAGWSPVVVEGVTPLLSAAPVRGLGPETTMIAAFAGATSPPTCALLRFAGGKFTVVDAAKAGCIGSPSPLPRSAWASSPSDVFVLTWYGVAHFDGKGWSFTDVEPDALLEGIWGTSPRDVFVVGNESGTGVIRHFDGESWSGRQVMPNRNFTQIARAGQGPIFAYSDGDALRFDDGAWGATADAWGFGVASRFWAGDARHIFGVTGRAPPNLLLHFDGTGQTSMVNPALDVRFYDVWGSGPDDVFAIGDRGLILHYPGASWAILPPATPGATAFLAFGDNDLFAVGSGLAHFDGRSWSAVPRAPGGHALWGSGPDDLFIANASSSPPQGTIYHFDGNDWAQMTLPVPIYDSIFYAISGSGPADVYAVGPTDTLIHFDGTAWSTVPLGRQGIAFYGVWVSSARDAFIVGQGGAIEHFDGAAWTAQPSGTGQDLYGVFGDGPSDVWAVGGDVILHYDGARWSAVEHPAAPGSLLRGHSTGPADAFVVGESGRMLHFDGTAWTPVRPATVGNIRAVWASVGAVYIGADSGLAELLRASAAYP